MIRLRSDNSVRNCCTSADVQGATTAELTWGAATSTILLASWASLSRSVVSDEASIILTFDGRRCRNNSLKKDESVALTLFPSSWWIRRSN